MGIKGRPVSSLEEARAMSIDFDGSIFYFPDLANRRIYTKQINLDGTATLNVYEFKEMPDPQLQAQSYITRDEFNAVIEQLKKDGIPYITATHDINNPRSGRVVMKLGMNYQYSYEEQWQPKDFLVTFRMYQLNLDGNSRIYKKYWNNSTVHFIEADV